MKTVEDVRAYEARIRRLLASIAPRVHPVLNEHVGSMLRVWEFRIAMEDLCELLAEEQVVLTPDEHRELLELATLERVDERRFASLPSPVALWAASARPTEPGTP